MSHTEIIARPSIFDQTERERLQDRRRQIRDRLLCALEDAGRTMTPHELARVTGLGVAAVTLAATGARRYFTVFISGKKTIGIDLHPHLLQQARR